MTATQREQRERHVARMNRDDLSVLLELRDIEDEISTILKLLDQQDTVLKNMMKHYVDQGCGKLFLESAQLRIDEYRNQLSDMKGNSHVAQKAVRTDVNLYLLSILTISRWKHFWISNRNRQMLTRQRWQDGKQKRPKIRDDR